MHQHRPARRAWVVRLLPAVAFGVVVIGTAAVAGWLAIGGTLTDAPVLLTYGPETDDRPTPPGAVPIRLTTVPAGAEIRLDGTRRGVTPTQLAVSPGAHTLLLHASGSVDLTQSFDAPKPGASISSSLWRLRPEVIPVRPVFPGAQLLDGQFVDDGSLALRVASSASESGAPTLWQLSSGTNDIIPISDVLPSDEPVAAVMPAADGEHVADATGAMQPSSSLWASNSIDPSATPAATQTASVVVSNGHGASQRTMDLGGGQKTEFDHVTDLIWTPDSQRLVVITRSDSTPARSRLLLVDVSADASDNGAGSTTELSVLPAEVIPGSASVDPSGQWLAFVAHATTASNTNDTVTLCAIELHAGGAARPWRSYSYS